MRTVVRALAVLRPPPELTISDWADQNRRLSSEASAEPGQWRRSDGQAMTAADWESPLTDGVEYAPDNAASAGVLRVSRSGRTIGW